MRTDIILCLYCPFQFHYMILDTYVVIGIIILFFLLSFRTLVAYTLKNHLRSQSYYFEATKTEPMYYSYSLFSPCCCFPCLAKWCLHIILLLLKPAAVTNTSIFFFLGNSQAAVVFSIDTVVQSCMQFCLIAEIFKLDLKKSQKSLA